MRPIIGAYIFFRRSRITAQKMNAKTPKRQEMNKRIPRGGSSDFLGALASWRSFPKLGDHRIGEFVRAGGAAEIAGQ
jgi:hypothetical protein